MKNVTVTMEDGVADWARMEAARRNTSVSRLIGEMLADSDIHLCVPADRTARIQETHLLVIHCLCDGIDALLLGVE